MDFDQYLESCIRELFKKRACFHSEDDFKFSLARMIKEYPNADIRLEKPFRPYKTGSKEERDRPFYIDIYVKTSEKKIGIELKYKTKELSTKVDGENYSLKNQYAIDWGRYGFCKDIERIETLISENELDKGFVIFLTNDPPIGRILTEKKRIATTSTLEFTRGQF